MCIRDRSERETADVPALSLDACARLVRDAAGLRRFLSRVHFAQREAPSLNPGALYHPTRAFELALERYDRVWMPVLASLAEPAAGGVETRDAPPPGSCSLSPPIDVEWIHFLHRLDPRAYAADCAARFGRTIDPANRDPFPDPTPDSIERARALWARHARRGEPFDLEAALITATNRPASASDSDATLFDSGPSSSFKARLIATATRQGGFLWQVLSDDVYDARDRMRLACERYDRLLRLWRDVPNEFLVPGYDQDLVWHAHMSVPTLYDEETRNACGRAAMIDHDDSVNDRAKGAKLDTSWARTRKLWWEAYDESEWPHVIPGATWRGDAPNWYWDADPNAPGFRRHSICTGRNRNGVSVLPGLAASFAGVVRRALDVFSSRPAAQAGKAVELAPGRFFAPSEDFPALSRRGAGKRSGWRCEYVSEARAPFCRTPIRNLAYCVVRARRTKGTGDGSENPIENNAGGGNRSSSGEIIRRGKDDNAWIEVLIPRSLFDREPGTDAGSVHERTERVVHRFRPPPVALERASRSTGKQGEDVLSVEFVLEVDLSREARRAWRPRRGCLVPCMGGSQSPGEG